MAKILVIRFSAFGDVTQALSLPEVLQRLPEGPHQIHWVTRKDLAQLLENHPHIHRIWALEPRPGWAGLINLVKLSWELRQQRFTHVYDAHNNLRSHILAWILRFGKTTRFLRKPQFRWRRFLLFRFRINRFEKPFSGQRDLLQPLQKWHLETTAPPVPQFFLKPDDINRAKHLLGGFANQEFIALAPSAAHLLKRWPIEHWGALILDIPEKKFAILGGPQDHFLDSLRSLAPDRVLNLAGKCSLRESAAIINLAQILIANDTGVLHLAEQLGRPAIALMGPAPFGFPSRASTRILELELPCRPCSKHGQGPCTNPRFQQCLRDISPQQVLASLQKLTQEISTCS
jgi:lipopolysaccharide heptosyltransferase II